MTQKLHFRPEWLADYGMESDVHPSLDDARILRMFRTQRVRSAAVFPLRNAATVSRLAELGIDTLGADVDTARVERAHQEAKERGTSGTVFITGSAELIASQFDLVYFDSVGLPDPLAGLATARAIVRPKGLLVVITGTGSDLDLGEGWQVMDRAEYRVAHVSDVLEGVLFKETATIAVKRGEQ